MRFLNELAPAVPALAAGVAVGRGVATLGAPPPCPLIAAIAMALTTLYVLNSLIDTLLAQRAASRG